MAERLEVTAVWRGGWATDVTARTHEVRVDEPVSGGGDSGMMPTELFIASLASCFCLAVGFAARKRGIDVPDLNVVVQATRAEGELRYAELHVDARAALDQDTLDMLVQRARPFCWVSNTLAAGVAVEYVGTSLDARFGK